MDKVISAFEKRMFLNQNDKARECPICRDEIKIIKLHITVCGHTFHNKCITDWLKINPSCPTCFTPVPKEKKVIDVKPNFHGNIEQLQTLAKYENAFPYIKILLEFELDIDIDNGLLLRSAIRYKNFDNVKFLLEAGASPHLDYDNILILAVENNCYYIVEILLKYMSPIIYDDDAYEDDRIQILNDYINAAMEIAIMNKDIGTTMLFIKFVNMNDKRIYNRLPTAIRADDYDIFRLLYYISIHICNDNHNLDNKNLAKELGNEQIIKLWSSLELEDLETDVMEDEIFIQAVEINHNLEGYFESDKIPCITITMAIRLGCYKTIVSQIEKDTDFNSNCCEYIEHAAYYNKYLITKLLLDKFNPFGVRVYNIELEKSNQAMYDLFTNHKHGKFFKINIR